MGSDVSSSMSEGIPCADRKSESAGERGSSDDACAEAEEPDGGPKRPMVQAEVENQLSWGTLFYCKGN